MRREDEACKVGHIVCAGRVVTVIHLHRSNIDGSRACSGFGGFRSHRHARAGFTLLELMFAVAVVAILAILAVGQFSKYVDRARNATAMGDIAVMQVEIQRYQSEHPGQLPASLSDIGRSVFLDPWQHAYVYTKLAGVRGNGTARKDHRLNPINSDYDLFSAGKNGVFKPQVSQKDSLDDIIRARNGGFVGLAEEF